MLDKICMLSAQNRCNNKKLLNIYTNWAKCWIQTGIEEGLIGTSMDLHDISSQLSTSLRP
ncbi:hypothetical protein GSU3539 [Geobacter sulfurreducens PCA]|uniref:Uncharacterized protein n=1 Tax=Geobacter sulfurreducens (strain ATCC 51573 / DSM 12127 / PCA) TaxID=243231 RepID=I7EP66_GEOSL|nr:hypothetical protein KN400_3452 [Geobacter sulfurreducens KN400]AFP20440.1 hypothetical protein GSU3539 [Geobacter sulfurreducens PCA]AJY71281.1 hypothetical protein RW64_17840 [Geobacter sulfurreducens]